MKKNTRKRISVMEIAGILSGGWWMLSILEVVCKNLGSDPVYSALNIFMVMEKLAG